MGRRPGGEVRKEPSIRLRWSGALAMALLVAGVNSARAQAVACTDVNALPRDGRGVRNITVTGLYCVTAPLVDFNADSRLFSNWIEIRGENIVLDLKGFTIRGSSVPNGIPSDEQPAISASGAAITVRNGTITGFKHAVIASGDAIVIEDLRVDRAQKSGINIGGNGSTVRRNTIVLRDEGHGRDEAFWGIGVLGNGQRIVDNDVVMGVVAERPRSGDAIGIWVNHCRSALVVNNRITQADEGVRFDTSTGAIRDNLTSAVANPYSAVGGWGYANAGNNF